MNRRSFLGLLGFGAAPQSVLDTLSKTLPGRTKKKFYITGTGNGNDCRIPPIVAYGYDRVNALLYCCADGGLTVWTEEEWNQSEQLNGGHFYDNEYCKELRKSEAAKEGRP